MLDAVPGAEQHTACEAGIGGYQRSRAVLLEVPCVAILETLGGHPELADSASQRDVDGRNVFGAPDLKAIAAVARRRTRLRHRQQCNEQKQEIGKSADPSDSMAEHRESLAADCGPRKLDEGQCGRGIVDARLPIDRTGSAGRGEE